MDQSSKGIEEIYREKPSSHIFPQVTLYPFLETASIITFLLKPLLFIGIPFIKQIVAQMLEVDVIIIRSI